MRDMEGGRQLIHGQIRVLKDMGILSGELERFGKKNDQWSE